MDARWAVESVERLVEWRDAMMGAKKAVKSVAEWVGKMVGM